MDCGFIQRECQCNIFNTLGDAVDGEDITEVVCKINEWKSTGTQTDVSGKATDSSAPKVVLNLSSGFKLSTSSSGQIITSSYGKPETVLPSATDQFYCIWIFAIYRTINTDARNTNVQYSKCGTVINKFQSSATNDEHATWISWSSTWDKSWIRCKWPTKFHHKCCTIGFSSSI